MDKIDTAILARLRRNARSSFSDLSAEIGVSRATIRSRIERLEKGGEILGYTVRLKSDAAHMPIRGLMMLAIEGRGAEKIRHRLIGISAVQTVHSTNGKWDLIAEIGTETLEEFDKILFDIRRIDGITRSETNLLLATKS